MRNPIERWAVVDRTDGDEHVMVYRTLARAQQECKTLNELMAKWPESTRHYEIVRLVEAPRVDDRPAAPPLPRVPENVDA